MSLDATVGASTANSYATVNEADEYCADRLHGDDWPLFEKKEQALITATKLLERYVDWNYTKKTTEQALCWPCLNAINRFGESISSTVIPTEVKEAVFELALSLMGTDRAQENDLSGIAELKVGPISISADKFDRTDTIPDHVWQVIGHFGQPYKKTAKSAIVELGRG